MGIWRVGDETWDVGRALDGYLEIWPKPGRRPKPLTVVLRDGVKVADLPGPLGPRPVVLFEVLAKAWLTPEQYSELIGALCTPSAGQRLLERIEQRILELDEAEQRRHWFYLWSHFARVRPTEQRDRCFEGLRAEFCRVA